MKTCIQTYSRKQSILDDIDTHLVRHRTRTNIEHRKKQETQTPETTQPRILKIKNAPATPEEQEEEELGREMAEEANKELQKGVRKQTVTDQTRVKCDSCQKELLQTSKHNHVRYACPVKMAKGNTLTIVPSYSTVRGVTKSSYRVLEPETVSNTIFDANR